MSAPRGGLIALTAAALALGLGAAASAGQFTLEGQAGYSDLSRAKDSAKAVFDGSSGGFTWGGGVGYHFDNGFFATAWARHFSKDGERVFVAGPGQEVFPLGHPLSVRIIPVQLTIGYRFFEGQSLVPYVGAGGGITSYHEESTVAGITDTTSETKGSGHVLAGIELGRGALRLGAEVGYTFVPNALGIGGVSQVYGESDIGGFFFVGKIVFTGRN